MSFMFHSKTDDDGSVGYDIIVPNGAPVTNADVLHSLALCIGSLAQRHGNARLLTLAELAAAKEEFDARQRVPDGWEASLDGASVHLGADLKVQARLKKYLRIDGVSVELNVDENEALLVGEADKLRAYDAENPPNLVEVPPLAEA